MDWSQIINPAGDIAYLLCGLALFLFGMKYMSENLQQAAGAKLRNFLDKATRNKFIGVIVGMLFTAFIQSSGATTVMEVGFVNSGILTLEKSVGLTLGANIGTSITSQLVSLKLTAIAPFIIIVGAGIIMFCKRPMIKRVAAIVFGFGALFTGINFMTMGLQNLAENHKGFQEVFVSMNGSPIIAILIGLIMTAIVQSSSVTVSVLVLLAGITGANGLPLVSTQACVFFIIGAYVGACTPAIMASLHANRNAKRTAFVYWMFNVVGLIVLGVLLALFGDQITSAIAKINGVNNHERFVANADTIFKIIICIVGIPLSNALVALSRKVIRSRHKGEEDLEEFRLKYINDSIEQTPATFIVAVTSEIKRMADMARENLVASMDALLTNNRKRADEIYAREDYIDFLSHKITEYMVTANRYDIPLADRNRLGGLFHVVIDLERIGDHAVNIIDDAWKEKTQKIDFSDEGRNDLEEMYEKVLQIYDMAIDIFEHEDKDKFPEINALEEEIDKMEISSQEGHVKRMADEKCTIEAGLVFTDIIIGLERIADHSMNIAYSILGEGDYPVEGDARDEIAKEERQEEKSDEI
ncbi:MAG: Na/Pi cotransporter family protein [Eubacterium sp.]|nr:Na/Pi cotransporter family protein [Eubacterium sp.]